MHILVFGGTGFVGRHAVIEALGRGHTLTLFHRGRSDAAAFEGDSRVEHVRGDRDVDVSALEGRVFNRGPASAGRVFDAVIDPSGYEPGPVRRAARTIRGASPAYVFVSTISVYTDPTRPAGEDAPVHAVPPADTPYSLEAYGGLKVACERALEEELSGRVAHVRAGLILGPHDYDERFKYWLDRIARGGEVLAPGDPENVVQFIDVRDLARFIVDLAERRAIGPFNATGPARGEGGESVTIGQFFRAIREETKSTARLVWVKEELLLERGLKPFSEMPFWCPKGIIAAFRVRTDRAEAAGLRCRPMRETVRDTLDWMKDGWAAAESVRANRRLRIPAGITSEREAEILREARAKGAISVEE
jgi:2'-hydroxyisoflavone reductase